MDVRKELGEKTFGEKASPIIESLAEAVMEHNYHFHGEQPKYSLKAFVGIQEIFIDALLDKMWDRQEELGLDMKQREKLAKQAGNALRTLVMRYTAIDPGDALVKCYGK